MFMYYSEAGFQAINPSGPYTAYVTLVRGPPLPQPDSSVPWGLSLYEKFASPSKKKERQFHIPYSAGFIHPHTCHGGNKM